MVVLATKVYGENQPAARSSLGQIIDNAIGELEVDYEVGVRHDGFPSVTIDGPDAVAARNVLIEEWGEIKPHLEAGERCRGTVDGWSAAGWHVDVGTTVTIGADELDLGPGDPDQVATRFGLVSNMPIDVVYGDPPRLADAGRDRLYGWQQGSGRVNANGVTRSQLRATINRAGHADDIERIERLGLLEQSAVCRDGTDPPGLLASIGPYVPGELACVI